MLNNAVTLYRFVFRFASRLEDMPPGDCGEVGRSEYEDMVGWYQGRSGMLLLQARTRATAVKPKIASCRPAVNK